jgi:hypothetical protein
MGRSQGLELDPLAGHHPAVLDLSSRRGLSLLDQGVRARADALILLVAMTREA